MQAAEGNRKIFSVILGICLVCSLLVSTAAVLLRPRQEENKRLDRIENILIAADLIYDPKDVYEVYGKNIKPILIHLPSGEKVEKERFDEVLNISDFNIQTLINDPRFSHDLPVEKDLASIERVPDYMVVYNVIDENKVNRIILPVYGKGLWSTLKGFVALNRDLRTIEGITFYEHGETPGLGGEIDNPRWKAVWKGKQAFDSKDTLRLTVLKGRVDENNPGAEFQVDGLAGATLTTKGVDRLVRFWLGKEGYGPFLSFLREEKG